MTHPSRPSLQDLHPTGDFTDQRTRADLDLRPLANGAIAPTEALLALARLLGRQAAREALKLEGKVGSLPTARGDFDNGTSPSTPQAEASSDAL